jgi:hypothetical protein
MTQQIDQRERGIRELTQKVKSNLLSVALECNITNPHLLHLKQLCKAVDDLYVIIATKQAELEVAKKDCSYIRKQLGDTLADLEMATKERDQHINHATRLESDLAAAKAGLCDNCATGNHAFLCWFTRAYD